MKVEFLSDGRPWTMSPFQDDHLVVPVALISVHVNPVDELSKGESVSSLGFLTLPHESVGEERASLDPSKRACSKLATVLTPKLFTSPGWNSEMNPGTPD